MKMELDNKLFIIFYSILNFFIKQIFLLLNEFYNEISFKKNQSTSFELNPFIIKFLI